MRAGTRRLVLLGAKSPANDVANRLTTAQKLALSDNPHGSVAALFTDCRQLRRRRPHRRGRRPRLGRRGLRPASPRDVRPRLHAATYEVVTWAEEILRAAHDARMRLAALRSPVLEPAVADIRAQLDRPHLPRLPHRRRTTRRLPALARYVQAPSSRRLDKLPDNAGRDAQQMAVVAPRPGRLPRPPSPHSRRRGQVHRRRPRDPLADRGAQGQPLRPDDRHPGPGLRAQDHDSDRPPHLTTQAAPRDLGAANYVKALITAEKSVTFCS